MARRAVVVTAVPLGALVALGGANSSSTFPLLVAAAVAFALSGGGSVFAGATRRLDIALAAFLVCIGLQMLPLPSGVVQLISPHSLRLQGLLQLAMPHASRTLTIDEIGTRDGFAAAAAVILVFWAARDAFSQGGLRSAARLITIGGAIAGLAGLAARATAPTLLLWTWPVADPAAKPYGPFVNRNHFATWLLMAACLAAGYLVAHLRSHGLTHARSLRLAIHDLLADGTALLMTACTAAILLALFASGSRGGLLGLGMATLTGAAAGRRAGASRRALLVGGVALVVAFGAAAWLNADLILGRLVPGTEVQRSTIWRETLPIVRDFPVVGTGVGTFRWAMRVYQQTTPELLFNTAHNEYLQLVAEGGVLLLIPAAVALMSWGALAWSRLRDDRRDLAAVRAGALAGICGVATQCIWESPLRMTANGMLLALLAAIVVHERRKGAVRLTRHRHHHRDDDAVLD